MKKDTIKITDLLATAYDEGSLDALESLLAGFIKDSADNEKNTYTMSDIETIIRNYIELISNESIEEREQDDDITFVLDDDVINELYEGAVDDSEFEFDYNEGHIGSKKKKKVLH